MAPDARRFVLVAALFAACALTWGAPLRAQELASIFVRVTDATGAPVAGLGPDDVVIVEDGEARFTVALEPVAWPVKLRVLIDDTPHVRPALDRIWEGLHGLLGALPDDVPVELVAMSGRSRVLEPMTTDRGALHAAVDRLGVNNEDRTGFLDAIEDANRRIRDDAEAHFPVVVVLAGKSPPFIPNAATLQRGARRILDQIAARPATYHVLVWADPRQQANIRIDTTLNLVDRNIETVDLAGAMQSVFGEQLAALTGGRFEEFPGSVDFVTLLPEVGAQVARSHERQRTQYRVTYQRPAGAGPAQQEIRVNLRPAGAAGFLSFDGRLP